MSWTTIRADEYCESVRDGTHDTPKQTETGYKLVTGKHIKNGQIDPSDAYCISEKDYKKINERSLVEQWDVLMSMIGTVGEVAVVKDHPNYAIKNVALFKCAGSELKGKWLAYYLQSSDAQGHMSGNQKGSSQQFLSLKQLRSLPVPVADETYMQKVVDILSTYDDLIENNQKQIKLLEEAAQRLYKEWFVDLRFPGHETTLFTDGIPEGWVETTIGEETEVRRGGSPRPIQEYLSDEGLNWLKISDATASNSPFIYQIKERIKPEGLKKTVLLKAGTIILSNSATPGIPKILKIDSCIHDGWLYFPNLQLSNEFMYHLFLQIRDDLVNRGTGAVFTNLRTDILKEYRFIKPDDHILELFNKQVKPIFSKIDCLHQQVLLLIEARDRLLPKLMNGEIEV